MRKIIHALLWLKRGLLTDYSKNIKIFSLLEKKININKNHNIKLLDIGSHSGSWTMPFCKYYKKSESICFEAYEYYYDVFRILIKFFPFYKISCHNYAVLDQETIVNIKLPFALLYFFSFNIAASYLKVEKAPITVNAAKKTVNSPNWTGL